MIRLGGKFNECQEKKSKIWGYSGTMWRYSDLQVESVACSYSIQIWSPESIEQNYPKELCAVVEMFYIRFVHYSSATVYIWHQNCSKYNGKTEFEILLNFNWLKLKYPQVAGGYHIRQHSPRRKSSFFSLREKSWE